MEDKGCFSKVCHGDSSQCYLQADKSLELSPMIKNHPSLSGREGEESKRERERLILYLLLFICP